MEIRMKRIPIYFAFCLLGCTSAPRLIGDKPDYSSNYKESPNVEWLLESMSADYEYGDFFGGRAKIKSKAINKYGYISLNGKIVIPPLYDEVSDFKFGIACVRSNGKYGAIDRFGNIISQFIYNSCHVMEHPNETGVSYIFANFENNYYYLNQQGDSIHYISVRKECDLESTSKKIWGDYVYGIKNSNGDLVFDYIFDWVYYQNGFIRANVNSKDYRIIDCDGNYLIPYSFYYADYYNGGICKVRLDSSSRESFIDASGKVIYSENNGYKIQGYGSDGIIRFERYINDDNGLSEYVVGFAYNSFLGDISLSRFKKQVDLYLEEDNSISFCGFDCDRPLNDFELRLVEESRKNELIREENRRRDSIAAIERQRLYSELAQSLNDFNQSLINLNQSMHGQNKVNNQLPSINNTSSSSNVALDRQNARNLRVANEYKNHDKNKYDYYMRMYRKEKSDSESYLSLYNRTSDVDYLEKSKDCEKRAADYLDNANIWK